MSHSFLFTTFDSSFFLFIDPLEGFLGIGRPPIMDVMCRRFLFRSPSSPLFLTFPHLVAVMILIVLFLGFFSAGRAFLLWRILLDSTLSLIVLNSLQVIILGLLSKSPFLNQQYWGLFQILILRYCHCSSCSMASSHQIHYLLLI